MRALLIDSGVGVAVASILMAVVHDQTNPPEHVATALDTVVGLLVGFVTSKCLHWTARHHEFS